MLATRRTDRGFAFAEFVDRHGSHCSIQESSLATEPAIWLGVQKDFEGRDATRMHLTQEMVADLLPLLHNFVASGELLPFVEALRRDGGWISVKEMMPPTEGADVANVIATDGWNVCEVYWHDVDGAWCAVNSSEPFRNMTHWQPLPPPPEELYVPRAGS